MFPPSLAWGIGGDSGGDSFYDSTVLILDTTKPAGGGAHANWASVVLSIGNVQDLSPSQHDGVAIGELYTEYPYIDQRTSALGQTNSLIQYADSADWDLGTGDFSLEIFGWNTAAIADSLPIISQWGTGTDKAWRFYWGSTQWVFQDSADGSADSTALAASDTISLNTDYDICVERVSGQIFFYRDGTRLAAGQAYTNTLRNSAEPLRIGRDWVNDPEHKWKALRLTKGASRHAGAASYTPDSLPLANST